MISIIISTKNEDFFQKISNSIQNTIGEIYEIVKIENNHQYSLCEAYNIGVEKSIFPYVCFVHDDVIFKTESWGTKLISHFENESNVGLVGVVGTKFKSTYPSAIGQSPEIKKKFMRGNIYQHATGYNDYDNSLEKKRLEDVICIDGVFMFAKKNIFQVCRFEETLLNHFHGYDIDFSLQVISKGMRVLVDREVLIEHFSDGNYTKENTIANRRVSKKWLKLLPVATSDVNLSPLMVQYIDKKNWLYFLTTALIRKMKNLIK